MTLHRSLRSRGAMAKHRNVLTRVERLVILEDDGRWQEGEESNVTGFPKVRSIKRVGKKKKSKKKEDGE